MRAPRFLAAACAALAVSAGASSPSVAPERREECFALALEAAVDGSPQRVGLARLARTALGADELLEWELVFVSEGVRVLHVERFAPGGAKLVWREVAAGRGRTVLAELGADAATLRVVDWSSERERQDVHVEAGALLPLAHLELVRRGELCDGVQPVFDPLSRELVPLATETRYEALELAGDGEGESWRVEREVETLRPDGTHGWSARFSGEELVRYRWQPGGLVAERIAPEEYRRELEALAPEAVESSAPLAAVNGG